MSRNGFTLVEVLVALTLAGLGLAMAAGLFSSVRSSVSLLDGRTQAILRDGNARSWLMERLASARVDADAGQRFEGTPTHIQFVGAVTTAEGWSEVATIALSVDGGILRAAWGPGEPALLTDSVASVRFAYLQGIGAAASWLPEWHSDRLLPSCVRLILTFGRDGVAYADTTLYPVGLP